MEYSKRMSGAAGSSTTPGFHGLPRNSANQRPTTALLSSCDTRASFSGRDEFGRAALGQMVRRDYCDEPRPA